MGDSMDENIKKLFSKMELEDTYYSYFEEAKLKKIIGNKEKDAYTFIIEINNILPVELYKHFIDKLKLAYEDIDSVVVAFDVQNTDTSLVRDYFIYLMKRYATKCPVFETFIDNDVRIDNQTLIIDANNGRFHFRQDNGIG